MTELTRRTAMLAPLALAACATNTSKSEGPHAPAPGTEAEIAALAAAISKLGPEVDPAEAARAARVSYEWTHTLAIRYEIVDPPIIHNMKVNAGIKPRGLCKHWAEDMEARLLEERFRTLDIHRAIGNYNRAFRIEHSTAIVSARGDSMFDGIVVDPWREGGTLVWIQTLEDMDRYHWRPQQEVFALKREAALREERRRAD